VWRPPAEPSPAEQTVIKAVRRAKLFVFLRLYRHELFSEQFQAELAGAYADLQMVLDRSPYPGGFPSERRAGYVPESALLAVEWFLPTFDIVPEHKEFRHVKTRKAVEPVARSAADAQQFYKAVIAQVAVRTVREVFAVCPDNMVSTVVFNGQVDTVDPATGARSSRYSSPCAQPERSSMNSCSPSHVSTRSPPSRITSSRSSPRIRKNSSLLSR
jgi:restriction system protein